MSHEVVFLPHILGQTWAQALAAARTAAREEDPRIVAARLEPWPDLVLHAAQILGQIEEFRGRGQRELVHPVTRLRFTFFGEDGVIALPYWYDGPVARMAATMAFRFAHAVESDTGLAAYDPQLRTPLSEMGLEKFVAGYLRGRERALGQAQARGPVPVGHALPAGRSATRRELAAGPSAGRGAGFDGGGSGGPGAPGASGGAGARQGADSSRPPREVARSPREPKAAPRQNTDVRPGPDASRPTDPARLRPAGPVRGADAAGREAQARPRPNSDQRQPANPVRRENKDARQAADSGPIAGSGGWLRRGKPARGEQVPRTGGVAEPRKAPRRGEPLDADPSQRSRGPREPKAPRRGEPIDVDPSQRSRRPPEAKSPRRDESGEAQRPRRDPEPRAPRRGDRPDAEQAQRSGKVVPPKKLSRRERAEAERAQRAQQARQAQQAKRGPVPPPETGTEWVPRPGRPEPPEPRRAPPPERDRRQPPEPPQQQPRSRP
ncbi:hypothetical protein Caci_0273 [Catenulispora acidiphila DSM 44928]|uniref:Uncharacterized protein n=1 Tax=Catenulispora acidiphila (strain DSM 44928 / JCM 14897 / NBRC 102108 / NRRL B-24433 / ID139908) TaxID=479433 RepID=C7QJ84_CATAD|nr:hypothetical protein [Catenulispora acidiphila]ACU69226.1 hypothetical protein Caci_0273 [Catenulispora acidiphila DSM 44928]